MGVMKTWDKKIGTHPIFRFFGWNAGIVESILNANLVYLVLLVYLFDPSWSRKNVATVRFLDPVVGLFGLSCTSGVLFIEFGGKFRGHHT
jgi:hypothetical protein